MRRVGTLSAVVFLCTASFSGFMQAQAATETRMIISRPIEVTTEKAPRHPWLMGLIDAYLRVRFAGRDEFDIFSYEATAAVVPGYNSVEKVISEDAWFKAAKALGANAILFHKYEYFEKESRLQYYVELLTFPDRKVVASIEKEMQIRTFGVEVDDAVLRLCEKLKYTASDRATKFFDKFLVVGDPDKLRALGQNASADFYSPKPDFAKIARRYAELARENKDLPICYWLAGRTYTRLGQQQQAIEMYKGFRDVFVTYGPAYLAMAESYRLDGQHAQVVEAARTARVQGYEPTSIIVEQLRGLDALGRKDDAYKVCLEVLERNPRDPFALFFVARWRVSEGRFDEGLKFADRLLEQDPNHGGAQLERGRALVGLKKPMDAVMPLTQATVLLPKDPSPRIELGDIYYARKDYAKAAGHYAEACKLKTDDLELFLRTAESYEYASLVREAIATLQIIEPKFPDELRLNAKLGLLQYAQKDTAGARLHLEKRVKSRVDDSLIFIALGDIYLQGKEYLKAINMFEQGLPLVKDKNRQRLLLAELFLRKGEPNNAISYLEQILSESPKYPDVYRFFGDAYRDNKDYDKAIDAYKKERQARGDDPYLQEQIAALYFMQQKYKEAEAECQRLAKVDPKNANAYYRLSIIALRDKNPSLAESYLEKAMKLGEADEEMFFRLGSGYASVSRWEAAEKSYKKCIEKNAKRYEAWAGLADVQLKAGKDSIAAETMMEIARFEVDQYREYSADAGKLFEKLGLKQKAGDAYNFYLGRKNTSDDVNLRLARIEYANKNYEAVHRLLGNQYMITTLGPADNLLLAESYMALKWPKDALPLLEKHITGKPDDGRVILLAADAAVQLQEAAKVIDLYRKYLALPKGDRHFEFAYRVADLLERQKDLKGAQVQFDANTKAYPDDIRNYERLGRLCMNTRDWDCAQAVLEAGVARPTASATINQMLATLYERLGMQDKATAQFTKYLSEAPQDSAALLSAGTLLYNKREYAKAIEMLKKAHALMPQNFESAFMMGDSYMRLGKTQEAVESYLEARRIRSTDKEVLAALAKCYTGLNDTRNLVPILREWMFVDEANIDIKAQLGKVLLEQHNTSEGARLLESVSRERPQDVEIRRLLAKVYESTGDEESFVRHVKEALQFADRKADLLFTMGKYYVRKKRRDLALEYFGKAAEADPRLTAAHYEYALLLREGGQTLNAYNAVQKCVELDPYNVQYLTLFSQVGYQMNKPEIAMDAIMRALEKDSSNVAALSWAGFLYNRKNASDEARPFLERALRKDQNCALCHEYLGDLYLYEGVYDKAADHFERSLAVRAYTEATSLKLAKSVLLSGQPEKAGLLFEKILNMNPESDEALYWLSHVYVTLGRASEAQNLPKNYKFVKKTGWLHLAQGEIYEAQENTNAALISFSVAARLMPDEPRSLAATGRMYMVKREFESAVEFIGKALGQDPHNPQYLLELGKAYEGLTDYASALQIYDEVIRNSPGMIDAYFWAARTHSKSGDHSKAIDMLNKGIAKKPGDARMKIALGHEYRAVAQFPKAVKTYDDVADQPGTLQLDGIRFAGITYLENLKDPGKAKKYFERYVKAGGKDPKVQELLASIQ